MFVSYWLMRLVQNLQRRNVSVCLLVGQSGSKWGVCLRAYFSSISFPLTLASLLLRDLKE